jgi:carboxyl-terminal processing protease
MRAIFKKFGLITSGILIGLLISLNLTALAEKLGVSDLPIDDLRVFAEVFGKVKSDYVEPVEDKKLIDEALTGMLQGLDPHSAYMDKDAYKDLQAGTQGEFGGLGIEVTMEDGLVKVVTPIEDSPARGMTLNDAVKIMRGVPGTTIDLTVLRKNTDKPLTFTITRDIIKSQSVKNKYIEKDYGYVRITQFQDHTGEDLAKALISLEKENKKPLKGLVLDLRNNPGGLLDAAVGVSAAFLQKDKLVVYTEGRIEDSKMHLRANARDYARRGKSDYLKTLPDDYKTVPMVVLLNAGSASASEIVAGALQDHKRATILGVTSFGKGSVQTILPMNNGSAIKLTTARYFTPNGRSIQAKGIEPDIQVGDGSDDSFRIHEADLAGHLSNPKDGQLKEGGNEKPEVLSNEKEEALKKASEEKFAEPKGPIEPASKDDFQFVQAMNFLKGLPVESMPKTKEKSDKS